MLGKETETQRKGERRNSEKERKKGRKKILVSIIFEVESNSSDVENRGRCFLWKVVSLSLSFFPSLSFSLSWELIKNKSPRMWWKRGVICLVLLEIILSSKVYLPQIIQYVLRNVMANSQIKYLKTFRMTSAHRNFFFFFHTWKKRMEGRESERRLIQLGFNWFSTPQNNTCRELCFNFFVFNWHFSRMPIFK